VTGDLVSSKGKDEVHPERALKQAAAMAAKKEKVAAVELDDKAKRQGKANPHVNGHGHTNGHGRGNVNGLRVKGDE